MCVKMLGKVDFMCVLNSDDFIIHACTTHFGGWLSLFFAVHASVPVKSVSWTGPADSLHNLFVSLVYILIV